MRLSHLEGEVDAVGTAPGQQRFPRIRHRAFAKVWLKIGVWFHGRIVTANRPIGLVVDNRLGIAHGARGNARSSINLDADGFHTYFGFYLHARACHNAGLHGICTLDRGEDVSRRRVFFAAYRLRRELGADPGFCTPTIATIAPLFFTQFGYELCWYLCLSC